MSRFEEERLESDLEGAGESPVRLASVYASLEARLGRAAASRLWWAAFAARDAAQT